MTTDVFISLDKKKQYSRAIQEDQDKLIDELSEFRFCLLQNGYEPIPIGVRGAQQRCLSCVIRRTLRLGEWKHSL